MNLDGGGTSSNELINWIENEIYLPIEIHTWLGGGAAVNTSVFDAVEDLVGDVVLVPVFNDYAPNCDPRPDYDLPKEDPLCDDKWHDGIDELVESNITNYYHIISFSLFRITDVSTGGSYNPGQDTLNLACVPENGCDAKEWLFWQNWLDANTKTIEGYFLEGYQDGMEGKCTNYGGAITIYLDH